MDLGDRSATIFKVLYSFLLGIAFLCVVTAAINPEKTLQLYPGGGVVAHLYADSGEPLGTSTAVWVDRSNSLLECNIGYGVPYPYCGIVIKQKHPDSKNYYLSDYFEFSDATTTDLSDYEGIYISLEYSGPSSSLYFFVRNADTLPLNFSDYGAIQFMHTDFNPAEKEVFIDFSRMLVARGG